MTQDDPQQVTHKLSRKRLRELSQREQAPAPQSTKPREDMLVHYIRLDELGLEEEHDPHTAPTARMTRSQLHALLKKMRGMREHVAPVPFHQLTPSLLRQDVDVEQLRAELLKNEGEEPTFVTRRDGEIIALASFDPQQILGEGSSFEG